jgi:hypothetical protein
MRQTGSGTHVKYLPELVQARRSRLGADIEEDAHVGLQDRAERVEEPAVRVDLFGAASGRGSARSIQNVPLDEPYLQRVSVQRPTSFPVEQKRKARQLV